MKKQTENASPLYKCKDCGLTTTTTDNLRDHMKEQHNKQQTVNEQTVFLHSCISCEYKTNDYDEMMIHSNNNHKPVAASTSMHTEENPDKTEETPINAISCGECGLYFATYHDAYSHMNTHLTQKEIGVKCCEICNYTVSSLELLSEHMKNVHGFKS